MTPLPIQQPLVRKAWSAPPLTRRPRIFIENLHRSHAAHTPYGMCWMMFCARVSGGAM